MHIQFNKTKQELQQKPKIWLVTGCAGFIGSNILAETTTNEKAFGEVFNTGIGGRLTLNDLYSSINR